MNEKFDFLPLGSIVVVSGGIKKLCDCCKSTAGKYKWL